MGCRSSCFVVAKVTSLSRHHDNHFHFLILNSSIVDLFRITDKPLHLLRLAFVAVRISRMASGCCHLARSEGTKIMSEDFVYLSQLPLQAVVEVSTLAWLESGLQPFGLKPTMLNPNHGQCKLQLILELRASRFQCP